MIRSVIDVSRMKLNVALLESRSLIKHVVLCHAFLFWVAYTEAFVSTNLLNHST